MHLIKQPNNWSCLLTAFSMASYTPIERLIEDIGHDGSEVVWPELPEPYNRRGFHTEEFIQPMIQVGYAPVIITPEPCAISVARDNTELFMQLSQSLNLGQIEEARKFRDQIMENYKTVYKLPLINNQIPPDRLKNYMDCNDGILVGKTFADKPHAVAWDFRTQQIFDPNGSCYRKTRFMIEQFIALIEID